MARADDVTHDVSWRTIETDHFRIHFYEQERQLARRATVVAEQAYERLTRVLNWTPGGRIDVVLTDWTDWANGYGSVVPRNMVTLFGVPPTSLSSLNDFDDWLTVLLIHELTHVIHMDVTLGVARLINFIAGKRAAPNGAQPNWAIEGMAVLMESAFTTAGRLRNSLYDMQLRMATLEGRLHPLDRVSNTPLAFPQGEASYLYGSAFMRYLRDRFGIEKLTEMVHRYGARTVPFAVNQTAREVTGETIVELWSDWLESLHRRYHLQRERVERTGVTPSRRLTREGETGGGPMPRWFPDGRHVVYQMQSSTWQPAFMQIDPATGERRTLSDALGATAPVPTPDGRALIFERTSYQPLRRRISGKSHLEWSDLFRLDFDSGQITQLTTAARAHSPDVSPDGTRIVCTVGTTGAARLAVLPVAGGRFELLAGGGPLDIAYSPAWSPDGNRIVYSLWKPGGFRDIHLRDLRDGSDLAVTNDRALDLDPRFTPDGRFIVFSSDRTGIYNLFAYEIATRRLLQITNVLGGAVQPAVSPDGRTLVFGGYSADGFDLHSMPLDPDRWHPALPHVDERVPERVEDYVPPPEPDPSPELQKLALREHAYQPWRHMVPRVWTFDAMSSSGLASGPDVGLSTTVSDPVGDHTVTASIRVPADADLSVHAEYSYLRLWPALNLGGSRAATEAADLIIDGRAIAGRRHEWHGFASADVPLLRRVDASSGMYLVYDLSYRERLRHLSAPDPSGGIMVPPPWGRNAAASLGWWFSNFQSWHHSVSGQTGRVLRFDVTVFDPSIGSTMHSTQLSWSWTEFLTPPWATLQAIGLNYHGGIVAGDAGGEFSLGGFQQQDIMRSFFLNRRQCCLFLRGYEAGSLRGSQYHVASFEYRAPLAWLERSYDTFPFYLRRLHGAVYSDVGAVSTGSPRAADLRWGVGAELRLDAKFAYYFESMLQLGIARGLVHGGTTGVYLVTSIPF